MTLHTHTHTHTHTHIYIYTTFERKIDNIKWRIVDGCLKHFFLFMRCTKSYMSDMRQLKFTFVI